MTRPTAMFPMKRIETEPIDREIMVHYAMHYKCDACGKIFRFWLEKGLEDKNYTGKLHKPVPFGIACLCGGTATHFAWQSDIRLDDYRPLTEYENYFENTEDSDCGISHFRNDGNERIRNNVEFQHPNLEELFEELRNKDEQELSKQAECDPYGLADVSTTTLKSELRRRKRWKKGK